ncbi:MAG: ABC transporter ATP-binding protein, partial [Acidimicrobiales bacterium]
MTTAPLLQVRDLVIEYATSGYAVRPIDGLDLDGHAGELIVLLGPSGCGKTSLLSVLGGILRPTAGTVRFGDLDVRELSGAGLADYRQRHVGFVFQAFNLIPSLNARENVAIPLIMAGLRRKAAMRRADELLHRVGLGDRGHHR